MSAAPAGTPSEAAAPAGSHLEDAPARRWTALALLVLVLALALGTGLRLWTQRSLTTVQHDEAWSYASAAGRLDPFFAALDGGLTGRWVPANDWQHFWQSDTTADLAGVAPGLAAHDVHPPLYFDVLHLWLQATGMYRWAGRALNLLFAALTLLALVGLSLQLRFTALEGALAALVWAVMPAAVSISAITRQYDLVALFAVLLVWGVVRARREGSWRRRWPDALWVAAATCGALLTHYQALLLVAGAALYALAGVLLPHRVGARGDRPWLPPVAGLAAGTLAAALLAPGWARAFAREGRLVDATAAADLPGKLLAAAETLGRSAATPGTAALAAFAALAVVAVVVSVFPRARHAVGARVRDARPGWWTIVFFLAVTAGGVLAQNLLSLSWPRYLSPRYLAMAWPFAAFVPLLFFGLWPRLRTALTIGLCLVVLAPLAALTPLLVSSEDRLPIDRLDGATAIVIDAVGPGALPRFLWSVPGDTPVFAASTAQLLADPSRWTGGELGARAYYVTLAPGAGRTRGRDAVLRALRARSRDVRLVGSTGLTRIYEVTPATSP